MASDSIQKLHLGAAFYPEHWPEDRWPEDVRLMREAGFTVARLAEFAWSTLEPNAGEFRFDWLDRAIDLLAENDIVTVLGTPTAAPPAWLVQQYPDMLPVDEYNRRAQFGNRTHFCVTSPDFHAAVERIVTAMGEHFGGNPNVIGWQFDNEYSRICYCNRCRSRFQEFLQEKFGSLDNLNERWSTRYWSQTYSNWRQIPIPIGPHNPGLRLAFQQFVTESYRRYQKLQLDALRPHLPEGVWVTHNFMRWFDRFDHYILSEDLDLASWDWYIGAGHHDHLETGAMHDLVRGYKRKNFWLMETQPGNVNWSPVNNALNQGEGRAMAWHAIGHGADAVLYWQWRSALGGQEQYHGSLVDQSGQPRLFYQEAQLIGREFKRVSDLLAGSTIKNRVAILNDYNSRWSIDRQRHHQDFDYVDHLTSYYRALSAQNIGVDIISPDALEVRGYKLVIVPAMVQITEELAATMKEFVRRGGYLVLTARSAMKDEYNALLPSRQPAFLAEIAGVEVEEYYALDKPVRVIGNWFKGETRLWAERLRKTDETLTTKVATYGASNGWLDDQLAITVHPHGAGMTYYVGTWLDDTTQLAFFEHIARTTSIKPRLTIPKGVEACRRVTPERDDIWILINHSQIDQIISLPWLAHEHLSGVELDGKFKLVSYGVAIITLVK